MTRQPGQEQLSFVNNDRTLSPAEPSYMGGTAPGLAKTGAEST